MISESDAKRLYPRNTEVIRKGDRRWKSDAGRELEMAATVPGLESDILTRSTHRPHADEAPQGLLPGLGQVALGSLHAVQRGRDLIWYEARAGGWHKRFTERNGAL
jgi:hypothetical protein